MAQCAISVRFNVADYQIDTYSFNKATINDRRVIRIFDVLTRACFLLFFFSHVCHL